MSRIRFPSTRPPRPRLLTRLAVSTVFFLVVGLGAYCLSACSFGFDPNQPPPDGLTGGGGASGDLAEVVNVIDGDTIEVRLANGRRETIRYLGVNTPERGETCYREATEANRFFVGGKQVRLVADQENRDRYDRLLRYIYVDNTFVNLALIQQGVAEAVLYEPNRAHYNELLRAEQEARAANRGCHPSGIFNDGSDTR